MTIPTSVTSIGGFAFSGTSLPASAVPSFIKSYASYFACPTSSSVTIASTYTSISDSAFAGCTSLSNVTIPTSITAIGASAFQSCSQLKTLVIPSSVSSVGTSLCKGCTSLVSVSWSSSVLSIGSSSFANCTSLVDVQIPDSVVVIESSAFFRCPIPCISWNKAISRTIYANNGAVTSDTSSCCPNGQYMKQDLSFKSGDYSPQSRSYSCSLCPPGTFAKGLVFTCTLCQPGYSSGPGSSECFPCPAGTASITPGSSSCTYW